MAEDDSVKGQMVYGRDGTTEGKVTPIDDGERHGDVREGTKVTDVREEEQID